MELVRILREAYNVLIEDFPLRALKVDKSRGKGNPFTSVGAHWTVERMNEVFGVQGYGWVATSVVTPAREMSGGTTYCAECDIAIQYRMFSPSQEELYKFGYQRARWDTLAGHFIAEPNGPYSDFVAAAAAAQGKRKMSDARKSALTEAQSKALSYIGVGNEIFKGQVDPATIEDRTYSPAVTEPPDVIDLAAADTEALVRHVIRLGSRVGYKLTVEKVQGFFTNAVFGRSVKLNELTKNELLWTVGYLTNQLAKSGDDLAIAKEEGKMAIRRLADAGDDRGFDACLLEIQEEIVHSGQYWERLKGDVWALATRLEDD